MLRVEPLC